MKPRYALLPQEGIPFSRLPHWTQTDARVLAAPVLGAQFVQYLLDIKAGGGGKVPQDGKVESFLYLLSGTANLSVEGRIESLTPGSFALIPPIASYNVNATSPVQMLLLRKKFEPIDLPIYAPLVGHESKVKGDVFMGDEGAWLQLLIPDEMQYDMAMNIFTFDVGHSLPYVETHVMEHGLYFLQGKGVYFLDDTWMEVEQTDFIWMGPYCPQSYYATGPVASKYIYYKNVNRDIPL